MKMKIAMKCTFKLQKQELLVLEPLPSLTSIPSCPTHNFPGKKYVTTTIRQSDNLFTLVHRWKRWQIYGKVEQDPRGRLNQGGVKEIHAMAGMESLVTLHLPLFRQYHLLPTTYLAPSLLLLAMVLVFFLFEKNLIGKFLFSVPINRY